jgi:hypothetical protein
MIKIDLSGWCFDVFLFDELIFDCIMHWLMILQRRSRKPFEYAPVSINGWIFLFLFVDYGVIFGGLY